MPPFLCPYPAFLSLSVSFLISFLSFLVSFLPSWCSGFFFLFWGLCSWPRFFAFPSCLVSLLSLLLASFLCFSFLTWTLGLIFLAFFVSLCFMKRTTPKYSTRQVSFTNLCFGVVSQGPPHLFGLCSSFFCWVGGGGWGGVFCCCRFGLCLSLCFFLSNKKHLFSPRNWNFCLFV